MGTKEIQDLTRKVIDRNRDLQKYDLIKMVCESYSKGEFGEDPEIVAPTVLVFVSGVFTDNIPKIRQAMSTLKLEKHCKGLEPHKLEIFLRK